MDSLPLEIIERILDSLPIRDVIMCHGLNKRFEAAALRQYARHCSSVDLSELYFTQTESVPSFVAEIVKHVRNFNVDVIQNHCDRICIQASPHLETLTFNYWLENKCDYDLSGLRELTFSRLKRFDKRSIDRLHQANPCRHPKELTKSALRSLQFFGLYGFYETFDKVMETYVSRCSSKLESFVVDNARIKGHVLKSLPLSVRRLHLTDTEIEKQFLVRYLKNNPNIEDFVVETIDAAMVTDLLPHLLKVKKMRLLGRRMDAENFAALANLHHLTELDIEISHQDFDKYPTNIEVDTQRLEQLNISIDEFCVTPEFATSFQAFTHVTRLTIFIGQSLYSPKLLLQSIAHLSIHHKLRTLVLAGFTEYIDLERYAHFLQVLSDIRVCPIRCDCTDHLKVPKIMKGTSSRGSGKIYSHIFRRSAN